MSRTSEEFREAMPVAPRVARYFVHALRLMLQHDEPHAYVVARGEQHSTKESLLRSMAEPDSGTSLREHAPDGQGIIRGDQDFWSWRTR
jgi:GDP-D-mannose dehydratase